MLFSIKFGNLLRINLKLLAGLCWPLLQCPFEIPHPQLQPIPIDPDAIQLSPDPIPIQIQILNQTGELLNPILTNTPLPLPLQRPNLQLQLVPFLSEFIAFCPLALFVAGDELELVVEVGDQGVELGDTVRCVAGRGLGLISLELGCSVEQALTLATKVIVVEA